MADESAVPSPEPASKGDGWAAFQSAEIRAGTVVEASPFPEARVPAIKLRVDFGEGDVRWSSAQITDRYGTDRLVGRQILALTNVPAKRIAGFKSEFLTLGLPAEDGSVVLIGPDSTVPNGARLY
ncbi:MAG: tRNA-binding protein [Spirochaetales bacterium]|nr:tRNA-binding protein [Spirochaetales bacterium]